MTDAEIVLELKRRAREHVYVFMTADELHMLNKWSGSYPSVCPVKGEHIAKYVASPSLVLELVEKAEVNFGAEMKERIFK